MTWAGGTMMNYTRYIYLFGVLRSAAMLIPSSHSANKVKCVPGLSLEVLTLVR